MQTQAAQQTGTQKSKKDKEIRQSVKIETVTVVAPCKRCPDLEKELQERIQVCIANCCYSGSCSQLKFCFVP